MEKIRKMKLLSALIFLAYVMCEVSCESTNSDSYASTVDAHTMHHHSSISVEPTIDSSNLDTREASTLHGEDHTDLSRDRSEKGHEEHAHHGHAMPTSSHDDKSRQVHDHAHHGHGVVYDDAVMMHDQALTGKISVVDKMDKVTQVSSQNDKKMGHGMNMGGRDAAGMDMHGMMVFHTGVDETVLFKVWHITSVGGLIASMLGIALLAMFYEGLKFFREHLFKKYLSSMQFSTVAVTGESGRVTEVHKVEKQRILSWAHAIQTCLHVIQIIISYFLMLIFMTYNVWLCLAVVCGAGIGYFIFGWKKATVVDITEHCH